MGQLVSLKSKLNLLKIGKVNANLKWVLVFFKFRPETKWSNHRQVEDTVTSIGGPNLYMLHNIRTICG